MAKVNEDDSGDQLEAMNKDSSWHLCKVSLSSSGDGLLVEFESQDLEDLIMNEEKVLKHLRFRSTPLQGDDCVHIKEGEHILATHKLKCKNRFYDAMVEKVLRVRHSNRIFCRCTFMIQWLQQDLKGETFTLPSSSLMKLNNKSVSIHPTIAKFLKSTRKTCLSSASPFPVPENIDAEMELNKLLEKQIEDISSQSNASKKGVSEDTIFEFKVDYSRKTLRREAAPSEVTALEIQVPSDKSNFKWSCSSSSNMQVDIKTETTPSSASSSRKEFLGSRSHLSPLAARAALASLMSSTQSDVATNGTVIINSFICKSLPMNDDFFSDISVASGIDALNNPRIEKLSNGMIKDVTNNENKISEISDIHLGSSLRDMNPSYCSKHARVTRSAVQKGLAFKIDDDQMKTRVEGKQTVARKKNGLSRKKDVESSPLDAEINILMEKSNKRQRTGTLKITQSEGSATEPQHTMRSFGTR